MRRPAHLCHSAHHVSVEAVGEPGVIWPVASPQCEDYTSKPCPECYAYNGNLGRKGVFKCPNEKCLVRMHRDGAGGKNTHAKKNIEDAAHFYPRMLSTGPQQQTQTYLGEAAAALAIGSLPSHA